MEFSELQKGHLYVIRGQGEMLYSGRGNATSAEFLAHGDCSYWAAADDVIREADWRDVDLRAERARACGLACADLDCWCHKRT